MSGDTKGANSMNPVQESDSILLDRFRTGDKTALDLLVKRHLPRTYAYALLMSRNHDLASDVVANTLVRVYRSAAGFKSLSAFDTWLHTLTRNCYLDLHRKLVSRKTESLDDVQYFESAENGRRLISNDPSPYDLAERNASANVLSGAMARLPDRQRKLVAMLHGEMLTYVEIARRLGVPIGTVKSRVHRARAALRLDLDSERCLLGAEHFLDTEAPLDETGLAEEASSVVAQKPVIQRVIRRTKSSPRGFGGSMESC
jgi:RNA polymerase sigma-70 factor (ECF subfamily)